MWEAIRDVINEYKYIYRLEKAESQQKRRVIILWRYGLTTTYAIKGRSGKTPELHGVPEAENRGVACLTMRSRKID
jgi:hypothetical protein